MLIVTVNDDLEYLAGELTLPASHLLSQFEERWLHLCPSDLDAVQAIKQQFGDDPSLQIVLDRLQNGKEIWASIS